MPRVTIPVVGKYGVIFDRPAQELPNFAWSDSLNVRHAQGGSTSFGGMKQAFANAAAEVGGFSSTTKTASDGGSTPPRRASMLTMA